MWPGIDHHLLLNLHIGLGEGMHCRWIARLRQGIMITNIYSSLWLSGVMGNAAVRGSVILQDQFHSICDQLHRGYGCLDWWKVLDLVLLSSTMVKEGPVK